MFTAPFAFSLFTLHHSLPLPPVLSERKYLRFNDEKNINSISLYDPVSGNGYNAYYADIRRGPYHCYII